MSRRTWRRWRKVLANVRDLQRTEDRRGDGREFPAVLSTHPAGTRPRLRCPLKQGSGPGGRAIALLTAKEIFDLVREDLVKVEQELSRQSAAAYQPVSEITSYLLGGGGKRLRPALLLFVMAMPQGRQAKRAAPSIWPRWSNYSTAPR